MKAILIARVSTEEQKEAGNSLPAQIIRLQNYCQKNNLTVIQVFSFDESAYKDDRAEFDTIFEFIMQHTEKIAVCCDKVDRLSRNMFDKRVSQLYDKALKDEIELHFVSDGQVVNSKISAAEKFHFGISLGLAKYYSDAISDNVKRALEQKLRRGEWPAKAPFGYKNIRHENGLTDVIIDEYNSQIIKKIFEWYATGAYSIDLIRQKLLKEFQLKWSKGYIHHILGLKFYCGTMLWQDTEHPHKYPTIISTTLFEQVQQVKAGFRKKPVKYAGLPYIYRGLIRCGDCGLTITPEKQKGYVYYHCTQYNGKHGASWWREEEITNQLGALFQKIHVPEDIAQTIIHTLQETHQQQAAFHKQQSSLLTKQHTELNKMLDNLYLDKLKGRITEHDHDKFYNSLKEQRTDIEVQMTALQEADENYYLTSGYILQLVSQTKEIFESSEVEQKRQLIKLLLQNLRIKGENMLWEVKKPFDLILNLGDSSEWCAQ